MACIEPDGLSEGGNDAKKNLESSCRVAGEVPIYLWT